MPIYAYKATKQNGTNVNFDIYADSLEQAKIKLSRKNLTLKKIGPLPKDIFNGKLDKVKDRDMTVFTKQLATMINSGVSILQALEIMADQTGAPFLRHTLYDIHKKVEGGSSLYETMSEHPKVFDRLFVNMIDAGEKGGVLDKVLIRLSDYIEKAARLKGRMKSAMIYPVIILTVAASVISILMIYVIPIFATVYGGKDKLPKPTQIVMTMSEIFRSYWWLIFGSIILFVVGLKLLHSKTVSGRRFLDKLSLNLPVMGPLLRKAAIAKFSRTFSTLVSSGVPLLESLTICSRTSGNLVLEEAITEAKYSVASGNGLSGPLDATEVFPPMVIHMISTGESTGALDTMLEKVADFYDEEVDLAVTTFQAAMEPIMIVILGIIVGGLVVAMYLPIFQLGDVIK